MIDVDSTQRIPCAAPAPWELSDLVAELSPEELDSITLVRAPARGPSWVPARRSELPSLPECPTLRQEIPRELLRMTELHDTDECPIADLSDDDLEWLDD